MASYTEASPCGWYLPITSPTVRADLEWVSLTDCGDFYIAKVAPCVRNWSIVIECNCFCFHCKEFVYHENGAILEIGMEISSLYLSQMEIKDLKIYMIDC